MAAGGHFGCPKITFDHSSCHFRSIRNFFFFWNFWTKWPPAAILDCTTMSVIELVRDIWMNNACVKFEERSLNPSKVIALTTKWCGGGRRRCGGGCVAVENIISPKTYVSREYNYNTTSSPLFKKTNILKLCDIYNTQISTFMYNYSKSNVPRALLDIFTPNNSIHSHQTRHSSDIHITDRNSETVSRSFISRCPDIWLSLPNDLKQSASSKVFKHKIKRHYVIRYWYNISFCIFFTAPISLFFKHIAFPLWRLNYNIIHVCIWLA